MRDSSLGSKNPQLLDHCVLDPCFHVTSPLEGIVDLTTELSNDIQQDGCLQFCLPLKPCLSPQDTTQSTEFIGSTDFLSSTGQNEEMGLQATPTSPVMSSTNASKFASSPVSFFRHLSIPLR